MKDSSSGGLRNVKGCETSVTKGVQNRDFSPFERARFDMSESKSLASRLLFKGRTFLEEFTARKAQKRADLKVGSKGYKAVHVISEIHGVDWE